jgi:hypothetical protein
MARRGGLVASSLRPASYDRRKEALCHQSRTLCYQKRMSRAYEKKASVSEVEGSGLVTRYSSPLGGGEPGLEATCFEKGIAWLRYPVT